MKNTEDWLKGKIWEYKKDPKDTLLDMLATTLDVMQQFNNDSTSKAAKGVFYSCIEHNRLFLIELGVIL